MLELRDYQHDAVQSIFGYFQSGNSGNPLIVAPTGSGKSLIIAALNKAIIEQYPDQRILILAHRKELLEQNAQELWRHWQGAPIGIYSAGLGIKNLNRQITIAGIASIIKRAPDLRPVDLVMIDEAHLVPTKRLGIYRELIDALIVKNENTKIIGLTATPFRLDSGFLHEGEDRIFTDIAFNIDVSMLVRRGFLAPLVGKISTSPADLSNVRIRNREYLEADLEKAFNQEALVQAACDELLRYGQDRKSWLLFSAGVDHAYKIQKALRDRNIFGEVITGNTPKDERARIIKDFREARLRACINCNVLTTGFNAKNIDLIGVLRATQSAGLYVQMLGRGMRTNPGKTNCLVLDFGNNLERHGPIDKMIISSRANRNGCEENKVITMPTKACPACRAAIHIAATECPECGHIMPREFKHETEASVGSPMAEFKPPTQYTVTSVEYSRHPGKGNKPDSFKAEYLCGYQRFSEWLCFEHGGPAAFSAAQRWKGMHPDGKAALPPETVEEALQLCHELKTPESIWVNEKDKFPRVVSVNYKKADASGVSSDDEQRTIFDEIGI